MVTQGPKLPPISSIPDLKESLPPVSMLCAKFGTCVHHFFQHFSGHSSVYDASLTAEGLGEAVDLGVQRQSVTGLVNTQQSAPALLQHRFFCGQEHLVAPKRSPEVSRSSPTWQQLPLQGPGPLWWAGLLQAALQPLGPGPPCFPCTSSSVLNSHDAYLVFLGVLHSTPGRNILLTRPDSEGRSCTKWG